MSETNDLKLDQREDFKIVINLNESDYPHAFKDKSMIHRQEYNRAIRLVEDQRAMITSLDRSGRRSDINDSILRNRFHNTISIFGGRGTGKTSFLHSLLDNYIRTNEGSENNDIQVLGIIDPTTLEEKGHPFLYIIALINECVENYLSRRSAVDDTDVVLTKKKWKNEMLKLAKGLPSLDSLGPDYKNNNWQDNDFIMEKGLEQVSCALKLESLFHGLVNLALDIIGKKIFMLAFDDVDVNIKRGWPIMECIRKYLTTPRIITLLSGNLKFYSNSIRINQWKQIEVLVEYEAKDAYRDEMMEKFISQVNEVEGQYLLKLFKAENRVYLNSIYDAINTYKWNYFVKNNDDDQEEELEVKYRKILEAHNIYNVNINNIYLNYLLSLSVRTQINFLSNNKDTADLRNYRAVDAFIPRMYASNIDVDLMLNNPRMSNAIILLYLLRYKILQESYLLLPTSENENINSCVTGLAFLLTDKFKIAPSIMFDYILRIGYIRNVLVTINKLDVIKGMCEYAGAFKDISLKNFIGLSMGYLASINENLLKEHIALYALASSVRQTEEPDGNLRIDDILNREDIKGVKRIISLIPLCALKYVNTNKSRLYYSVFNLLAAVGQILKVAPDKKRIISELQSLQLLRYYPINSDAKKSEDPIDETDLIDGSENAETDSGIDILADALKNWAESFDSRVNEGNADYGLKYLPPYVLGRIATRLYSVIPQVKTTNLGDTMHRHLVALLNGCLIEEANEIIGKYEEEEKYKPLLHINYSNSVNSDKIFKNNLKIVKKFGWNHFGFTEWLISCPLIHAFLNPSLFVSQYFSKDFTAKKYKKHFSVYEVLSSGSVKSGESGAKTQTDKK